MGVNVAGVLHCDIRIPYEPFMQCSTFCAYTDCALGMLRYVFYFKNVRDKIYYRV